MEQMFLLSPTPVTFNGQQWTAFVCWLVVDLLFICCRLTWHFVPIKLHSLYHLNFKVFVVFNWHPQHAPVEYENQISNIHMLPLLSFPHTCTNTTCSHSTVDSKACSSLSTLSVSLSLSLSHTHSVDEELIRFNAVWRTPGLWSHQS